MPSREEGSCQEAPRNPPFRRTVAGCNSSPRASRGIQAKKTLHKLSPEVKLFGELYQAKQFSPGRLNRPGTPYPRIGRSWSVQEVHRVGGKSGEFSADLRQDLSPEGLTLGVRTTNLLGHTDLKSFVLDGSQVDRNIRGIEVSSAGYHITRLPLIPGWGGKPRIPSGQLVRPDDHLPAFLPLEHDYLV